MPSAKKCSLLDDKSLNQGLTLMEFPLKPGTVTVACLSQATGSYRLVIGTDEMQRAPKVFPAQRRRYSTQY
jgi:hypothetical protein